MGVWYWLPTVPPEQDPCATRQGSEASQFCILIFKRVHMLAPPVLVEAGDPQIEGHAINLMAARRRAALAKNKTLCLPLFNIGRPMP